MCERDKEYMCKRGREIVLCVCEIEREKERIME